MQNLEVTPDFGYTEEVGLLRQSARDFLANHAGVDALRKRIGARVLHEGAGTRASELDGSTHRQLCELGWLGIDLPEAAGGAEMGTLALAVLVEQMGEALLCGPFLVCSLAARAIAEGGSDAQRAEWLPALLSGHDITTVALSEADGSWGPDQVQTQTVKVGSERKISGVKTHVEWARQASHVLVPSRDEEGTLALYRVALDAPGVSVQDEVCVDLGRQTCRVSLQEVVVDEQQRLGGDARSLLRDLHARGWLLLAAEALGGAETCLEITRQYAIDRIQFGKPIGAFQAVKHPIVNVMIACENSRSLVYAAAAASGQPAFESLARMAKACASEAYNFATDRGVQLHGGFGFTWDCDIHFHYKRALWINATLGDAQHHRQALSRTLCET